MTREELEKKADKLSKEYDRVQGCLTKLGEIESLEEELQAKKKELEKELRKEVLVDSNPTVIINPAKTYVALDKTEIPCVTKGSVSYSNVGNTTEEISGAFRNATFDILNRIYNKEVGGVYDSLGECPEVNYIDGAWCFNGWGKLTKEEDDWKLTGLSSEELAKRFTSRKLSVIQIGDKFCCGSGASSAMSAIIRSILWNESVNSPTVRRCIQLNSIYRTLNQSKIDNFRSVLDFGLKGNNGYVVLSFVKILEHFEVRDILKKITFWSCPGKGAKSSK